MHFLFIVDSYDVSPSANGVCVRQVVNSLLKKGHRISIICQKKSELETNFSSIGNLFLYKIDYGLESIVLRKKFPKIIIRLIRRFRFINNLLFFPVTNSRYVKRIIKKAMEISLKSQIDVVVSVTQITDHIKAGIKLKAKLPNSKLVVYTLDAMTSGYVSELKRFKFFFMKKMKKFEINSLNKCDRFIAMESHKKFILSNDFYNNFFNKIVFADVPLFLPVLNDSKSIEKGEILYTGNMSYLSEKQIRKVLELLPEYHFTFVGPNNTAVKKISGIIQNITVLDPVSHEEIILMQARAEYLLAFDTQSSSMIPGKIFEYFATKKTVIFCSETENSNFINYFEKYGNYVYIKSTDSKEQIRNKMSSIHKCNDNFESLFIQCTPDYTAELLDTKTIF